MKRRNVETSKHQNGGSAEASNLETLLTCDGVCGCPHGAAEGAPTTVRLTPDGKVDSINGEFFVDAESGRLAQQTIESHGVLVPIDYEHQTLGGAFAARSGRAPAAGWLSRIWHETGKGLFADLEWTEKGGKTVAAKEYRYLSPVAILRKSDRKLVGIHSVGLTNKPAIPHMDVLVAKQQSPEELKAMAGEPGQDTATGVTIDMLVGMLAQKLGIDLEGKTDPLAILQAILAAVPEKGGGKSEGEGGESKTVASKTVLEALGAKEGASESEVMVAIKTLKKEGESVAAMTARLKSVEDALSERMADDRLRPHIESGRINPKDDADMKECRQLAMKQPEAFEHHMQRRKPDPPPGKTTPPPGGTTGNSREAVIANAAKEYDEGEGAQITSRIAWIDGALKEAGNKAPLTPDEQKTLAVA